MRTNDVGIAVPHEDSPIPWKPDGQDEWARVLCGKGTSQTMVCEPYFLRDAQFISVAANYHERMSDLVRRLLDWHHGPLEKHVSLCDICNDAAALWAEYREEVQP
jgi:hypothetical protein